MSKWRFESTELDDNNRLSCRVTARHPAYQKSITINLASSVKLQTCRRILLVLPGYRQNTERYMSVFRGLLNEADRCLVVVPQLTRDVFPVPEVLALNNMVTTRKCDVMKPQEEWVSTLFSALISYLMDAYTLLDQVFVFGHSAGAQLAHRIQLLDPLTNVSAVFAANSGWYTVPNIDIDFPFGVKGLLSSDSIRDNLQQNVYIMIGTRDTKEDFYLWKSKRVNTLQGLTRYDRANYMMQCIKHEARIQAIKTNWRYVEVANGRHKVDDMAPAAIGLMRKLYTLNTVAE